MKYQIVLQWPATSVVDYEQMIAIEAMLEQRLSDGNDVDGHDVGSGETNIFIRSDDPMRTFRQVKDLLSRSPQWEAIRIAYREVEKGGYSVLWPKGLKTFKVV